MDRFRFGEGGFGFIVEGDPLDVDALLREVADAVVLWFGDFTAIWLKRTTDAFHEGRLASAIVTSEGDTLFFSDGKGEVLENDTGAKFDTEVFDGKHAGWIGEEGGLEKEKDAQMQIQ